MEAQAATETAEAIETYGTTTSAELATAQAAAAAAVDAEMTASIPPQLRTAQTSQQTRRKKKSLFKQQMGGIGTGRG